MKEIADIKAHHQPPWLLLPSRLRIPVLAGLCFIVIGALLQQTIGNAFIFSWANEYRAARPWLFFVLLPMFAVGWFRIEKATSLIEGFCSGQRFRWLLVFPFVVALSTAIAISSPLGWAALSGVAIGKASDHVEVKVLSIDVHLERAKHCDVAAELAFRCSTERLCLERQLSGRLPRPGENLVVTGRVSRLGLFIEEARVQ